MGFHTFGPGLALDKVTMRGLPSIAPTIVDADTGDPVQAYTMGDDPQPTTIATNLYGYFPQFQTPDTVRRVRLTFGTLTLDQISWEDLLGDMVAAKVAAEAARVAAEASQQAAEDAAALIGIPADQAIALILASPSTQTRIALDALYMAKGSLGLASSTEDGLMAKADKATLDTATGSNTGSALVRRYSDGTFTTQQISLVGTPTATSHAARKDYVDNLAKVPQLGYKAKKAEDAASTYPTGYSTGLFAAADGWPHPSFSQVVTFSPPGYTGGTVQWAYSYTDSSLPPKWRSATNATGNPWGPWREIADTATTVRKGELFVNVRDYGAVGDGVTDDAPAFKLAMEAARDKSAFGGVTVTAVPAGDFNFGSGVRIYSHTTVALNYSTVRRTAAPGYVAFCAYSGGPAGYGSGGKNITLREIRFRGDFANGRALNNVFHHVDDLTVERCTFTEAVVSGHALDLMGCRRIKIRDVVGEGRYEVEGRAYCELVQIDHSGRSNAGGELPEAASAWDGLPCEDIVMERCESKPLKIGSTTYLAPRLIGSHSRIAKVYHKNLTIRDVKITDSGPTDQDQNYRGWIHFIHFDGILIDGYTAISTRNDNAAVLGFGSVATTYPLSSVAESSPTINSDAGPVGCRNITVKNLRIIGNRQPAESSLVLLAGQSGASIENVEIEAYAENFTTGSWVNYNNGSTVVDMNYGDNVRVRLQANDVRQMVNVTNSKGVTVDLQGKRIYRSVMRVADSTDITMCNGNFDDITTQTYFTGVSRVKLVGNSAFLNDSTSPPYSSMNNFTGCSDVVSAGNTGISIRGSAVQRMNNFYGGTSTSSSSNDQARGFPVNGMASGLSVTIQGEIQF